MAINIISVHHNGGFLPGIILLNQCYYRRAFVAHLMLVVMVLNMPEQCSFQDLLFHLLFNMPKNLRTEWI